MFYVSSYGWMTYKGIGGAPNSCGHHSPSVLGFVMESVDDLKPFHINGQSLTMISMRGEDAAVYYLNLPFEEFDEHMLEALQTGIDCLDLKNATQILRDPVADQVELGVFAGR